MLVEGSNFLSRTVIGSVLCDKKQLCSGITWQATASSESEKNSGYSFVIARGRICHARNLSCTIWDYSSNHHGLCVSVLDLVWWLWYFRSGETTISSLYIYSFGYDNINLLEYYPWFTTWENISWYSMKWIIKWTVMPRIRKTSTLMTMWLEWNMIKLTHCINTVNN